MKISKGARLLALGILLVVIDQVSKYLVKTNMDLGEQIPVIGQWFRICFVENAGMAFGMKFGGMVGKFLLSFFRIILCGALVWWISSLLRRGVAGQPLHADAGATPDIRYRHAQGQLKKLRQEFSAASASSATVPNGVLLGLTLITAGAFGNIIDCLFYGLIWDYAPFMFGKVVDMLYFPIIRSGEQVIFFSPVFNFADSCVTVGAFWLLLFHWKFFAKES